MNLTKTWMAAILLSGAALGAVCSNLNAQTWQPKWQAADGSTATTDWDQRVLKQAQPVQQASVQQSVDSYQSAGSYRMAQRSSFDRNPMGTVSMETEPATPMNQPNQRTPVAGSEIIEPGMTQFEPMGQEGPVAGDCPDCGNPCGTCGACNDCCDFGWEVFDGRCGPLLRGLAVFAGTDAFKGPLDRGTNGNFGLNEGLNLARPLGDPWGCGYQLGVNFVQSDFSGAPTLTIDGDSIRAPFRRQYFATAAIFNRALCGGFQWGVAYDFLQDNFYQTTNLQQIRSESSYVINDTYTVGYSGAYGVGTDRVIDGKLDPTDQFVLFIRRTFENGGDGRLWGGATGNGDGILGADLWVPLGSGFALENRINYMIPKQGTGAVAETRESWGFVVQLVWYPGQCARCQQQNPYRPMFNVADNSLFMVDRLINH